MKTVYYDSLLVNFAENSKNLGGGNVKFFITANSFFYFESIRIYTKRKELSQGRLNVYRNNGQTLIDSVDFDIEAVGDEYDDDEYVIKNCDIGQGFEFFRYDQITLSVSNLKSGVYSLYTSKTLDLPFGHNGEFLASIGNSNVLDITVSVNYECVNPFIYDGGWSEFTKDSKNIPLNKGVWKTEPKNDNYLYFNRNYDLTWSEFTKDNNGYPFNKGIWKKDNQNDGYLYIVGYKPIHKEKGDKIILFKNGQIFDVDIVEFENNLINPSYFKILNNT
jgi:hypothetical protein